MINEDLSQYDRITQILKSQSAPKVQQLNPQESTSAFLRSLVDRSSYGAQAEKMQQLNLDRAQQAQQFEMEKEKSIFDIANQRAAAGDKVAEKMLERAKLFVGDDANAQAQLLDYLHKSPDQIDPNNAYQLNSAFARGAKELGLRNVDRELDLQKKRADIEAAKRRGLGGGGGGGGVFGAKVSALTDTYKNKFGVEPSPEAQMQILSAAAAPTPQGSELYFDDDGLIQIRNFGGRVSAAGELENVKEKEKIIGKAEGENTVAYEEFLAATPQFENTAEELYRLADAATYTAVGKFSNAFQRQLGVGVGSAAEAKAKYENIVKVEILPILRATFGAQFTKVEGEWLLSTLGDTNLSAEEKKAQLDARVEGWIRQAQTMAAKVGKQAPEDMFKNIQEQRNLATEKPAQKRIKYDAQGNRLP